ncbi:HET-domain-containing protein [Apiospora sp. TS-2023a]
MSWSHLRLLTAVCDIIDNVSSRDLNSEFGRMYEQILFRGDARRMVKDVRKLENYEDEQFLNGTKDRRRMFLTCMKGLESKLPHDKIYGLYPILRIMKIDLPDPDYSAPIEKVAHDFTRAAIASLQTLDVFTSDLPYEDPTLPSWIPRDLTNPKPEVWARQGESVVAWCFEDEGKRSKALLWVPETATTDRLGVFGKRIGVLKIVLACTREPLDASEDLEDLVRVFREWCRFADARPDREAAMDRIFTSDKVYRWQDALLYPDCRLLEPQEVVMHNPPQETDDPVTIISNYFRYMLKESPTEVDYEKETLQDALVNGKWAFVTTDNGYAGRAYRTCREEDEVWLLAGSSDPVVLRPAGTTGEFYYITPGYFYGMMDKENWPVDGSEGLEMITLV